MEVVLGSPGLSHIIQKILRGLDFKSLVSCRLVCKSANNQVKYLASKVSLEDLEQLLERFSKARSMTDFEERQWNSFLIHMFNNWSESINDWSELNKFMNLYLKEILSRNTKHKYINYPILDFVLNGNKEMVQYIMYTGDSDDEYFYVGGTTVRKALLQEVANSLGHTDICETLKSFTIFKKFSLSTLEQKQLNEGVQSDSGNGHIEATAGPNPSPSSSP